MTRVQSRRLKLFGSGIVLGVVFSVCFDFSIFQTTVAALGLWTWLVLAIDARDMS